MTKKYTHFLKVISIVVLVTITLKVGWHYVTVTMITYGPFEVQVITPEPMEDIVLVMGYDHGRTFGLRDDIYREVRIVSSGEWVTLPSGVFQYGGKPSMKVSLYHPRLKSSTTPALSSDALKHWDGGAIKFSVAATPWKGADISTHLMRMNRTYLQYFAEDERNKLSKYVSFLEQRINSASDLTEAYYIMSARENLEQFKAEAR